MFRYLNNSRIQPSRRLKYLLAIVLFIITYPNQQCDGQSIKDRYYILTTNDDIYHGVGVDHYNISEYDGLLAFHPDSINALNWGETAQIYVNRSQSTNDGEVDNGYLIKVESNDESIARVLSIQASDVHGGFYIVTVQGEFIGRTHLEFSHDMQQGHNDSDANREHMSTKRVLSNSHDSTEATVYMYPVAVVRHEGWLDQLFMVSVSLVVIISNISLGCTIDLNVVKEVMKKPIAPLIGFTCQFVIMPLVAYSLVVLLDIRGGQALGFFATGCSPGGGASNMYTYLLGGDVSLSVTMTLVSTTASFAMIPLWLYTLGTHFIDEQTDIKIPFENILLSLAGILVPVLIGVWINRKKPEWSIKLQKCLKPLFIFLLIFMFTFGMWVNSYLFGLFTINLAIAATLLPLGGFVLSGLAALVCRQPAMRVVTILVETGIQNTGIPILLMKFSLPQPEADMSVVSPVMITFFEPFPLWIAIITKEIHKKLCSKGDKKFEAAPSGDEINISKNVSDNNLNCDKFQKVFMDPHDESIQSPLTSTGANSTIDCTKIANDKYLTLEITDLVIPKNTDSQC